MTNANRKYLVPFIYNYSDYRKFLQDFYNQNKERNSSFSYKFISQKVGFKSPGLMTQIFKGITNISNALAYNFSDFMELDKNEKKYFSLLLQYNQTTDKKQKDTLYQDLIENRRSNIKTIEKEQQDVCKKWYTVAIRELLNFFPFNGNYDKLSKKISPHITPNEAKNSVALLKNLGIIKQEENSRYILKDKLLTLDGFKNPDVLREYHTSVVELGKRAISKVAKREREISTITCSISNHGYKKILDELHFSRRRILEIAKNDTSVNRVYQVNFQFFPLTEKGNV